MPKSPDGSDAILVMIDSLTGMLHLAACKNEAVRTKVRRESQEFGMQQFKAVLEELLERPACRDTDHKELLWNISKQLIFTVGPSRRAMPATQDIGNYDTGGGRRGRLSNPTISAENVRARRWSTAFKRVSEHPTRKKCTKDEQARRL